MNERTRRRTERMSRSVGTLWVLALALGLMVGAALFRGSNEPADEGGAVAVVASPEPAPRPEPLTVAGPRELFAELESEARTLAGSALGELRAHVPGEREARERPLALAFHRTSVRIVGNVARTEIEETFRNDGRETLEGVYRFPLPPDAQIASLSLEVDGRWESGAFVEREHARKIWRGVIRQATPKAQRRQEEFIWVPGPWEDPAILEWQAGGRFELRIFPIPGRGERRIRLAYTQTLPPHGAGRRFVVPLAASADASTRVERFEVIVEADGPAEVATDAYDMHAEGSGRGTRLSFAAADFLPTGDLIVDTKESESASPLRWWTFGGSASAPPPDRTREDPAILSAHRALFEDRRPYVLFALRPDLPLATETEAVDHVLVVDSSQSMVGERYTRAIGLAEAIVGSLGAGARFGVLACDFECTTLSEGLVDVDSEASTRVRSWLESIRPAGASNVAEGLERAVEFARCTDRPMQIVYVGDGMASVGPRKASSLAAEVRALIGRAPHAAISTVGIGGDADLATLAEMARAGGGVHVAFTPGRSRRDVARTLIDTAGGNALVGARLELPEGIEELTPRALPTMRPGQEILLAARLDRRQVRGEVRLRGEIAGQPYAATFPVEITATDARGNAFVAREWARRAIDALEVGGDGEDVPKIVALSKAYGVLSRHTSLLVLESEAMFRAFGVDRREPSLEWTGEEAVEGGAAEDLAMSVHEAPSGTRGASGGLGRAASAPAEMERREAPASARKKAESSDDAFAQAPPPPSADALVALPAAPVRRPSGRMMREVVYREGIIARSASVPAKDLRALQSAESALRENPDSRDRHRALVRALSRVGDVEGARQVAERWLERDPLDPEALTYLADALGRMGDQKNALRMLSGVVDLAPNGDVLHQRLANAFERGGMPERACGHHVARAEVDPTQAESVGAAIRCERARGRIEGADRLLASMSSPVLRDKAENAARSASLPSSRGELVLDASWSRGVDLDVSIITPEGTRLSWMGGRVQVVGEHGRTPGRERLGLRRAAVGSYLVEIARTDPNDHSPIVGRIDVQALGQKQTLPFSLDGARVLAGRVDVVRRTRLEPVW